MLTYTGIVIFALSILFLALIYILFLRTKAFDKYFEIHLEESYNLDDLFPIKINGQIVPKVDYLEIPYESLEIEINTKTIRGSITNNTVSLELIRLNDRKHSLSLIKKHYTKNVHAYIVETIRNKKEYIELINISKKQTHYMKQIACNTCKHKMQCEIAFKGCNYERATSDAILSKGLRVNNNKNYELDSLIG